MGGLIIGFRWNGSSLCATGMVDDCQPLFYRVHLGPFSMWDEAANATAAMLTLGDRYSAHRS